jgi:hypothetical protein
MAARRACGRVAGMFHRWRYDLTAALRAEPSQTAGWESGSALVVQVDAAPYLGAPNGSQGGTHEGAKNAAFMQFTLGWDWIQVRSAPGANLSTAIPCRTKCAARSDTHSRPFSPYVQSTKSEVQVEVYVETRVRSRSPCFPARNPANGAHVGGLP